jgi:hypothetical protein
MIDQSRSNITESNAVKVQITYANGTTKVLQGENAHVWVSSVRNWCNEYQVHGGFVPEFEWASEPKKCNCMIVGPPEFILAHQKSCQGV